MNHLPVTIRKTIKEDFNRWSEMRALLWPSTSSAGHLLEIKELCGQSGFVSFVAETSCGNLIGFCEGSLRPYSNGCDFSPVPFAEGCWVSNERRRENIGEKLMSALEDWALAAGFKEIGSDCEISNAPSQQFHRALGFEERERVIYFRKVLGRE